MTDKELLNNYYDMNPVFTKEEIEILSKLDKLFILDNFLTSEDTEEEVEKLLDE